MLLLSIILIFRNKTDKTSLEMSDTKMKSRMSEQYGVIVENAGEEETQLMELYDDEYDDTYDINNIGVDDADADEFMNR